MALSFVVLVNLLLWNFRVGICCPDGYIYCMNEHHGNCIASGVIAFGMGTRYTYQTSSGSIICGIVPFGDPIPSTQKECCSQSPTLNGPVSPIVGSISCGETIYSNFGFTTDIHYWKLTTNDFNDITYSLCDSSFNTRITVHNSEGTIMSLPYCPANNNKDGDDCNTNTCSSANNEYFTIEEQLPDTYYIKIMSFDNDVSGNYQLSVSCSTNEYNFDAIGCWTDEADRAMSLKVGNEYTVSECQKACLKYKYFGIEWGWQCYCDNSFNDATRYGRSLDCGKPCNNADVNCPFPGHGGDWAINLYHNQYDLILDHKNVSNGYFSTNLKTTGLENENDTSANTYSIIGNIVGTTRTNYIGSDSKYTFKLIYRYSDGSQDILNWKQTSWITDSTIIGADLFDIPPETSCTDCDFEGLGLSTDDQTYIDGDGDKHIWWYHSVGSNVQWNGGIPGFNEKPAFSESLYILNPIIPTLSPTRNPTFNPTHTTNNPTNAPTNNPSNNPTRNPTLIPTRNPTRNPTYNPTPAPTNNPTAAPTNNPTNAPTNNPTPAPTRDPTPAPTINPTLAPSISPTTPPTNVPTYIPSIAPSLSPTYIPTNAPSTNPTLAPSNNPTYPPTIAPTVPPSAAPSSKTISVGRQPTHIPTATPTTKTTAKSVDVSDTDGKRSNSNGTGGLMAMFDSVLMIILSVTIIAMICCCCFIMFLLFLTKRKGNNNKRATVDFMQNEQSEGMSDMSGNETATGTTNVKTIEMGEINANNTMAMTRVNSTSTVCTPNTMTGTSNPNSPFGITATPYQIGSMPQIQIQPQQQQQTMGMTMGMTMHNNVSLHNTNNNILNEENEQNNDDDEYEYYDEDEDDDDLNELYGAGGGDDDSKQENYDAMYQTAGGPQQTAGQ